MSPGTPLEQFEETSMDLQEIPERTGTLTGKTLPARFTAPLKMRCRSHCLKSQ
jgi:hypothetical protein